MPFGRKPNEFPSHLWTQCPNCNEMLFNKQLARNLNVCTKCEHHFRLGARERIELLVDKGSFHEHDATLTSGDPLGFTDSKPYPERIAAAQVKSGEKDAVITGEATIGDNPVTLAVMDFENLSRNPDDDWIGSGVAEGVAAELARVPGLSVVARAKAVKVLKGLGGGADALELGHALGCRWVLSGSYQRMGPALRMTSRLTEVSTGRAVATEKLDGKLEEIFSMQDRLASSTAAVLNLTVPEITDAPAPPSLDAYESHARGRRLFHQLAKGTFEQARELFEQAIASDPAHAPSLAGLSAIHAMRFTFTTDKADLEASARYAERSIAADGNLGEPHVWLGYALWRQWKVEDAFREERRAMELDPANPFAPYFAGWCRMSNSHVSAPGLTPSQRTTTLPLCPAATT